VCSASTASSADGWSRGTSTAGRRCSGRRHGDHGLPSAGARPGREGDITYCEPGRKPQTGHAQSQTVATKATSEENRPLTSAVTPRMRPGCSPVAATDAPRSRAAGGSGSGPGHTTHPSVSACATPRPGRIRRGADRGAFRGAYRGARNALAEPEAKPLVRPQKGRRAQSPTHKCRFIFLKTVRTAARQRDAHAPLPSSPRSASPIGEGAARSLSAGCACLDTPPRSWPPPRLLEPPSARRHRMHRHTNPPGHRDRTG
jgi:hypothetical protein